MFTGHIELVAYSELHSYADTKVYSETYTWKEMGVSCHGFDTTNHEKKYCNSSGTNSH